MSRIMTTNFFEGETHYCYDCEKDLIESEIEGWRCNNCGERVRIDAGLGQYIMRKLPEEVHERDLIILRDNKFYELYKVEMVNKEYYYNVKGYRRYKQNSEDWVNCMYSFDE